MRPAGGTLLRTRVSQFMNVLWRLPQHLLLKQPTPISQNLSPQAPAPGPGCHTHPRPRLHLELHCSSISFKQLTFIIKGLNYSFDN